eukprot:7654036-Pyramimonas_sp.AAC.1
MARAWGCSARRAGCAEVTRGSGICSGMRGALCFLWRRGKPRSPRARRKAPPVDAQGGRWSQCREGRLERNNH